jgi:lysozyme family protein
MQRTYDAAMVKGVFPHEGGYSNHPSDPGGPTNWGITIIDARLYWKKDASAADVEAMPKDVAEDIYRKHYATPLRYNDLPAGVDYSIMDYGVNSGIGRAGKVLRRLVGLPDNTSAVTDEVIAAVNKRDPVALIKAINDERLAFLQRLKTWPVFGDGWGRRVREVRALSLQFAQEPVTSTITVIVPSPPIVPSPVPMGKGVVPEPKVAKNVVVVTASAGSTSLVAWAYKHPALAVTAASGVVIVIVIGGAFYLINKWHEKQQHAPTPGIQPVPEAA